MKKFGEVTIPKNIPTYLQRTKFLYLKHLELLGQ